MANQYSPEYYWLPQLWQNMVPQLWRVSVGKMIGAKMCIVLHTVIGQCRSSNSHATSDVRVNGPYMPVTVLEQNRANNLGVVIKQIKLLIRWDLSNYFDSFIFSHEQAYLAATSALTPHFATVVAPNYCSLKTTKSLFKFEIVKVN